jgi:stage II sporulation protein D
MDDEDPLTDQAISETAGEVLVWQGQPADALYSSTCGGHTEDVAEIFPLKHDPYLRAVPCLEAGLTRLGGDAPPNTRFPDGLTRRLLPPSPAASAEPALGERLAQLAALAGLPAPTDGLGSLDRRELQRYLASLFDLAADARLFVATEDLPYLLESPPAGWGEDDVRLAAYLLKSGLFAAPLERPLAASDEEELLLRLAIYLGVLEEREVSFRGLAAGKLTVADANGEREIELPSRLATFREVAMPGLALRVESGDLALLAGDRLRLYRRADDLVALVQVVNREGVAYDRTSNRSSWTRFRSDSELARLVKIRYPEVDFASFEILRRGRSGRASKIRLLGQNGRTVDVEGLAVRWTLDLPDTWFTAKRVSPRGKEPGWLFTGRGWGHGVGMCQVGSFGMAVRGHGYREILLHYYSGVEIARTR